MEILVGDQELNSISKVLKNHGDKTLCSAFEIIKAHIKEQRKEVEVIFETSSSAGSHNFEKKKQRRRSLGAPIANIAQLVRTELNKKSTSNSSAESKHSSSRKGRYKRKKSKSEKDSKRPTVSVGRPRGGSVPKLKPSHQRRYSKAGSNECLLSPNSTASSSPCISPSHTMTENELSSIEREVFRRELSKSLNSMLEVIQCNCVSCNDTLPQEPIAPLLKLLTREEYRTYAVHFTLDVDMIPVQQNLRSFTTNVSGAVEVQKCFS